MFSVWNEKCCREQLKSQGFLKWIVAIQEESLIKKFGETTLAKIVKIVKIFVINFYIIGLLFKKQLLQISNVKKKIE